MQHDGARWTIGRHLSLAKRAILSNAHVERVLFESIGEGELRAVGVVYSKNGREIPVRATKAVILAAGTVGTPTILLKSGIGPADFYADQKSLRMQMNHPAVGQYLQDHVTTGLDLIMLNDTFDVEPWKLFSFGNVYSYLWHGAGPLTMTGCEVLGFVRSSQSQTCEHDWPDLGFMVIPLGATIDAGAHIRHNFNINDEVWRKYFQKIVGKSATISIMPVLLHPRSYGSISLEMDGASQWKPKIDPRYLHDSRDADILVEGLKIITQMIEQPLIRERFRAEIVSLPFPGCEQYSFGTDQYWHCYVRHLTLTAYHPIGSCRMGMNRTASVVNSNTFNVHGIENLFVCDASIMPNMPSGNPQAVVGMIAEKFLSTVNSLWER